MTPRLNVASSDADAITQTVICTIQNEERVEGFAGLRALLEGVRGAVMLDLIGHARKGELEVGDWTVSATDEQVGTLPRDKLESIRLLGCYTAAVERGRKAMRHLKTALGGVKVYGATNFLVARDYDAEGLTKTAEDAFLREVDQLPHHKLEVSDAQLAASFQRLEPVELPDLRGLRREPRTKDNELLVADTRIDDLIPRTVDDVRATSGLLAQSDREVLVPVGGDQLVRVSYLFDDRIVRVYPEDHPAGVMFLAKR